MSAFDPSQQSPAVRLRLLIESIGLVAREPGYGEGYSALGEVQYLERNKSIDLWIPPQDERPMQLRIGTDQVQRIGIGHERHIHAQCTRHAFVRLLRAR